MEALPPGCGHPHHLAEVSRLEPAGDAGFRVGHARGVLRGLTDSGFGVVRCAAGHRHWGRFGAAGLLLSTAGDDPAVLLQRRSRLVQHGGTWGLPGGALHRSEDAVPGALRETAEETDLDPAAVRVVGTFFDDHGRWAYTTVLGRLDQPVPVVGRGREVSDVRWFAVSAVPTSDLHPGLAATWSRLLPLLR
jgi:8-oxo-dGTP pyrophosphatase MutT (NUDIX family)